MRSYSSWEHGREAKRGKNGLLGTAQRTSPTRRGKVTAGPVDASPMAGCRPNGNRRGRAAGVHPALLDGIMGPALKDPRPSLPGRHNQGGCSRFERQPFGSSRVPTGTWCIASLEAFSVPDLTLGRSIIQILILDSPGAAHQVENAPTVCRRSMLLVPRLHRRVKHGRDREHCGPSAIPVVVASVSRANRAGALSNAHRDDLRVEVMQVVPSRSVT